MHSQLGCGPQSSRRGADASTDHPAGGRPSRPRRPRRQGSDGRPCWRCGSFADLIAGSLVEKVVEPALRHLLVPSRLTRAPPTPPVLSCHFVLAGGIACSHAAGVGTRWAHRRRWSHGGHGHQSRGGLRGIPLHVLEHAVQTCSVIAVEEWPSIWLVSFRSLVGSVGHAGGQAPKVVKTLRRPAGSTAWFDLSLTPTTAHRRVREPGGPGRRRAGR